MKISHKLCDRMDGTQFLCFLWFPANSLLCVILRYTVQCNVCTYCKAFEKGPGKSIIECCALTLKRQGESFGKFLGRSLFQ